MKKRTKSAYFFILRLIPFLALGQEQQIIAAANLYKKGKLKSVNREIKIVSSDSGAYLKVSENKKEGIIWLPVKGLKKRRN